MADPVLVQTIEAPNDDVHRRRHWRAWHFQVLVLVAAVASGVLAVLAYWVP